MISIMRARSSRVVAAARPTSAACVELASAVCAAASIVCCTSLIVAAILRVEARVESASFLISLATTPNPRPASPACAASMAALMPSKFAAAEISSITSTSDPIACEKSRTFAIAADVARAPDSNLTRLAREFSIAPSERSELARRSAVSSRARCVFSETDSAPRAVCSTAAASCAVWSDCSRALDAIRLMRNELLAASAETSFERRATSSRSACSCSKSRLKAAPSRSSAGLASGPGSRRFPASMIPSAASDSKNDKKRLSKASGSGPAMFASKCIFRFLNALRLLSQVQLVTPFDNLKKLGKAGDMSSRAPCGWNGRGRNVTRR